jgi:hypothetical protein
MNKEKCKELILNYKKTKDNTIINPFSGRKINITKAIFIKLYNDCNNQRNSSSSSSKLSEEFSIIKKNMFDKKYTIDDVITVFRNKSVKKNNGIDNTKREFLLTQLHIQNLECLDSNKPFLELLQREWIIYFKTNFDVDILNDNFEIVIRSNKINYYYDLRVRYTKYDKIIEKKFEFKFLDKYTKITELPQIKEFFMNSINMFSIKYSTFYYINYLDKLILLYNEKSKEKLQKPELQIYEKYVQNLNCSEKGDIHEFIKKIKELKRTNKEFRSKVNVITKNSINDYLQKNFDSKTINLDFIYATLKQQKQKHYIIWSRRDYKFFYDKINNDIINDLLQSKPILVTNNKFYTINIIGKFVDLILRVRWSNGNSICNPSLKVSLIKK